MDVVEAIKSRRSIRGYKPDQVPKEVIREILQIAARAPSALNTQPWEITVATGKVLDNIRRGHVKMFTSGTPPSSDTQAKPFEGVFRKRQVEVAVQLFQLMGIAREDKAKRAEWSQQNLLFYNAPTIIILYSDQSLGEGTPFGVSAFAQNICLTALNYGLGTCIQAAMMPAVMRQYTGINESKRISVSIAIGYPDWDFPANKLISKRDPIDDVTTWCGFD